MNHHSGHKGYRTSAEDYQALYDRIQEEFDPKDMSAERLARWLNNDSLAHEFSQTKDIYDQVNSANSIEELKELKEQARNLLVHRDTIINLINDRITELVESEEEMKIARVITQTQNFAQSRKIILNERTRGGVYNNWGRYHRPAIVIFSNGKIKAWSYLK